MFRKLSVLGFIVSFVFVAATVASAGDSTETRGGMEHPSGGMEHPSGGMEHPMDGDEATSSVDKEALAIAITNYVNKDTKLKGGFFMLYDSVDKKPLALTLTKVHKDRLSKVGENLYFACSDFKEVGGTMYDLDFFMKSVDDNLMVTEVKVHKKADTPRYKWHEMNGVWMTMEVK